MFPDTSTSRLAARKAFGSARWYWSESFAVGGASAARAAAATAIAIIAAEAMTEVSIARLGVTSATAPRAERLVVAATASDTPIASTTRAGAVRYAPARPRTNHTSDQTRAPIAHAVATTCGRADGHRRWTIRRSPAPAPYHARTTRAATTSAAALSARAGPRPSSSGQFGTEWLTTNSHSVRNWPLNAERRPAGASSQAPTRRAASSMRSSGWTAATRKWPAPCGP